MVVKDFMESIVLEVGFSYVYSAALFVCNRDAVFIITLLSFKGTGNSC